MSSPDGSTFYGALVEWMNIYLLLFLNPPAAIGPANLIEFHSNPTGTPGSLS